MKSDHTDEFFDYLSKRNLTPEGELAFGWNGKSVGSKVLDEHGQYYWAKFSGVEAERAKGREWEGEAMAAHWVQPWKPMISSIDILGTDPVFQFVLSEVSRGKIFGSSQYILKNPEEISVEFLVALKGAMYQINKITTDRVNTRFDLVKRRIKEIWGLEILYRDCTWETIHGDLHWQNLAGPELGILDWEGWGIGLKEQDLALLLCFSGLYPSLIKKIESTFFGDVDERALLLAKLFVSSELLMMARNYGDHPDLVPSLERQGQAARHAWLG